MAKLQKLTRWLRLKKLSEQLNISQQWLYIRTMKGEIPFHRIHGSRILWFDPDEIDRWLKNQPPRRQSGRPRKPRAEGDARVGGDGR